MKVNFVFSELKEKFWYGGKAEKHSKKKIKLAR